MIILSMAISLIILGIFLHFQKLNIKYIHAEYTKRYKALFYWFASKICLILGFGLMLFKFVTVIVSYFYL